MRLPRLAAFSSRRLFLIGLLISIVLASHFAYRAYNLASSLNKDLDSVKYVSDETWYVTASRNILTSLGFKLVAEVNGTRYATIFFADGDEAKRYAGDAGIFGVKVVLEYSEIPALGVRGEASTIEASTSLYNVTKIVWGYPYPDRENIDSYYNLEHPPLGKLFISLSMLLFGDLPLYWRLPGIVAGFLVLVIAYIIGYRLAGVIGGLLASIVLYFDNMLLNMASIAMLEIYVILFLSLTLLLLVYRRMLAASIALGLAGAVKLSGFFVAIPLYLAAREEGYDKGRAALLAFIMPPLVLLLACAPIYPIFGVDTVIVNIVSSLGWHTSIKHELTKGPPVSAPWEWFYNANPFYFHFEPDLAAVTNPPLYIGALVLSIVLAGAIASRRYRVYGYPALFYLFILGGYLGMYVMGGRTQYSYYASLFTPLVGVVMAELIAALSDTCIFICSLSRLAGWIRGLMSLEWISPRLSDLRFQQLASAALAFWALSFLFHMPDSSWKLGEPSFYSDFMAVYGEFISGNIGRIPYFEFYFNRPPLVAVLAFFGGLAADFGRLVRGGAGEVASFYLFNSLVSLLAVWTMVNDLWILGRSLGISPRLQLLFLTPSFIMFSCYDWTIVAAALMLHGYVCYVEGRRREAILSLALAALVNPYALVAVFAMAAAGACSVRDLYSTLGLYALFNAPLLVRPEALAMAYERFMTWYSEGSIWLLLPEQVKPPFTTSYMLLLGILAALLIPRVVGGSGIVQAGRAVWLSLGVALGLSNVFRPQYSLLILPFLSLFGQVTPLGFYLFDILNVGVIVLWWSQESWSQLLFKASVPEGYSPLSIVGWMAVIRSIILLVEALGDIRSKPYSSSISSSSLSSSSESSISNVLGLPLVDSSAHSSMSFRTSSST